MNFVIDSTHDDVAHTLQSIPSIEEIIRIDPEAYNAMLKLTQQQIEIENNAVAKVVGHTCIRTYKHTCMHTDVRADAEGGSSLGACLALIP